MSVIFLLIDINNKYRGGKNVKKGDTFLYQDKGVEKEIGKIEELLSYVKFSFREARRSIEKKIVKEY